MAFRVFRFRRFSSLLLLLLAGLIALVQLAVYQLISSANERNAIEHIEQNLQIGARLFHQNLNDRINYLTGIAKVTSGDYAIRLLLMQNQLDPQTLRSNLISYAERAKAPSLTLFSTEGDMLASNDAVLGAENVGPYQYLIRKVTDGELEQASDFAYLNGKLHVLVVVPVYAPFPNVAAWFGIAYPIDASFAQAIKSTTRLEVTFTTGPQDVRPRVLSTTLAPDLAAALVQQVAKSDVSSNTEVLNLGGEPYVTLVQPLTLLGGDNPVRIALQRSLREELAPARDLENIVLLISLTALGVATLAALWIARGVSQPVQQLAAHTRLVAAGDYTQRIELHRDDELGQLATAFNQMTAGLADRDRVRDLLGKVVSPEIAAQLLKSDVKLGGEEREVTMLFCDLRNFTTMSEKMPAAEVLALLNRYLDRMSTIIEQHGGVIDKYIGDAIMALYGAPLDQPDAASRALDTARVMADSLHELNLELTAEGKPQLEFGIGINTGRVVAGNMGSNSRLNYTVIGDGVNLASRLETLTKDPVYRTAVIVSEATARAAGQEARLRPLGAITVKGKTEAVRIYALDIQSRPWPEKS